MPRLGITVDYADDFATSATEVTEFERAGIDVIAVAEAYSFDAVSRLGYLAAITERVTLLSAILPIFSRTPALIAMTAAGLDSVSGGRFELGLGSSGAQVVEGFHGVPFRRRSAGSARSSRSAARSGAARSSSTRARATRSPLPGGLGKPLKLINEPVRASIPIALASITPKAVEQTAEIADGWLPLFFHPTRSRAVWGEALDAGAAKRDPALGALDVIVTVPFHVGPGAELALEGHRQRLALYVGGMGAKNANFYNDLAVRYGYEDEAARVQELYLAGEKDAAAAALPDDLVRDTALIGTEQEVQSRVDALVAAGVSTLMIAPLAPSRSGRIAAVEAARAMLPA
ncbi:MAG: LLM class F420-dependent oxidoreductase [Actinobacteria bacterium]|nr:LLM class F420-dependent oxidoreductase [Actinomycetota bacterium]